MAHYIHCDSNLLATIFCSAELFLGPFGQSNMHPTQYFYQVGKESKFKCTKCYEQLSVFSESMMDFSNCPKNIPKTILKKKLKLRFVLCKQTNFDLHCNVVSKGTKIQNAKLRIEQHIFWTMEIIPIFFRGYPTFIFALAVLAQEYENQTS